MWPALHATWPCFALLVPSTRRIRCLVSKNGGRVKKRAGSCGRYGAPNVEKGGKKGGGEGTEGQTEATCTRVGPI